MSHEPWRCRMDVDCECMHSALRGAPKTHVRLFWQTKRPNQFVTTCTTRGKQQMDAGQHVSSTTTANSLVARDEREKKKTLKIGENEQVSQESGPSSASSDFFEESHFNQTHHPTRPRTKQTEPAVSLPSQIPLATAGHQIHKKTRGYHTTARNLLRREQTAQPTHLSFSLNLTRTTQQRKMASAPQIEKEQGLRTHRLTSPPVRATQPSPSPLPLPYLWRSGD
ncbi:hypothetical protein IWX90DRAFT_176841 [Phyllosticta citrichinensis]|uniref:Uncharacterized protein n=1 Tax=Phyllosticta citrichinensis TaxID=1130410 RepID=A0ABR1XW04_9PEZI